MRLPIWLDPSNENPVFSRNRIRHQILPVLEEISQGCCQRISDLAERLSYYQEDQKAISQLAIEAIRHKKGLYRQDLIALPLTARATILAKWIEEFGIAQQSSKKIKELSQKIDQSQTSGSEELSENWKMSWTKEYVEISLPNKI